MNQKRVFQIALAALAIMLMILPFVVSINDILTKTVEKFGWYIWIQHQIVPWEVKMVGVVVRPLGIDFVAYPEGFTANDVYAELSWNCIGWQSLFLFLLTLPFGFKGGDYTRLSMIEAFLIGVLGTFLINLSRIVFTVILLVVSRPLFAVVFHDYLAAVITIVWLLAFWWFAYAFVLEEKIETKNTSTGLESSRKLTLKRLSHTKRA
jgi:exosortase/archaeosortase family protein